MVYADGSEYKGQLNDGLMHGIGHYKWPIKAQDPEDQDQVLKLGHNYIGMWKNGLMHGNGKFSHCCGQIFSPAFSNNLAQIPQCDHFVTPFLT